MDTFLTIAGTIFSTLTVTGIPAYILVRNHILKEKAKALDLRARTQGIDFETRQKTHALDVQEQDDILAKMQELMDIERKNNEIIKQERLENYRKEISRIEKRLEANEKKTHELEDKERQCAELAIKQQAEIDQLKQKNTNQAEVIIRLQEDIKTLQVASHP